MARGASEIFEEEDRNFPTQIMGIVNAEMVIGFYWLKGRFKGWGRL